MKNYLEKNVVFFKGLKTVKHYARQACLVLAILLVTVSCEKEEVVSSEPETKIQKTLNITINSWEHLKTNNKKVADQFDIFRKENYSYKRNENTLNDFFIDESKIQIIEQEGHTTYTAYLQRNLPIPNLLENYVYKAYDDGTFEQYILKYKYAQNDEGQLHYDPNFLELEPLDNGDIILSRSSGGCFPEFVKTTTMVCEVSPTCFGFGADGDHEVGDACKCQVSIFTCFRAGTTECKAKTIYTYKGCSGGGTTNPTEPGDGNPGNYPGGGTTTTGGTTNTGGTTTTTSPLPPKTIPPSTNVLADKIGIPIGSNAYNWLNENDNARIAINDFLDKNNNSPKSKLVGSKTVLILSGDATVDILSNVEEHKLSASLLGNMFTALNANLFSDYETAFNNLDPNNVLEFSGWLNLSFKTFSLYNYVRNIHNIENILFLEALSNQEKTRIEKDSIFITMLAAVKEIYQNYAPKNAEQWATLGSIVGTQLLDIGTDFIPGVGEVKDAIRAINALNNGNYVLATENLAFAIVGIIPVGKLLKNLTKFGKAIFKAVKIFKKIIPFINELGRVLNKGFDIGLGIAYRLKLTKNGRVIAQGDDVVKRYVTRSNWKDNLVSQYGDDISQFVTRGLDPSSIPTSVKNNLLNSSNAPSNLKEGIINDIIRSGSTTPVKASVSQGDKLVKIVPSGESVSDFSPYWTTKAELDNLRAAGQSIEQKLGLPIGSHSPKYDIFEIKATQTSDVFTSTVAPTVQNGYETIGGATQTLVLDRSKWNSPVKISSFIP